MHFDEDAQQIFFLPPWIRVTALEYLVPPLTDHLLRLTQRGKNQRLAKTALLQALPRMS